MSAGPSRRSRLFRVAEDGEGAEDDDAGAECAEEAVRPRGEVRGRRSRAGSESPRQDDVEGQSDRSGDEQSASVVSGSEGGSEEIDGASSLAESVAATQRGAPTSLAVDGGVITATAASSVTKRNGSR
jgi:hypothetical protein